MASANAFVFLAIHDRRKGSRNRCRYRCCTPRVSTYKIPPQWEHVSDLRLALPGKDDRKLWLERGLVRSLDPGGLRSDVVSIRSCEAFKNNSEDRKVLMAIKTGVGLHCSVLMMCTGQHLPFWDLIGSMVPSLMWLQCQQGWYLGTSHLHVWIESTTGDLEAQRQCCLCNWV